MTKDIEWGAPIAVDGKRPQWLLDYDIVDPEWDDGPYNSRHGLEWHGVICKDRVQSIRLPADHFAYRAIEAGFEPWGGGGEAPADWDGGEVLWVSGNRELPGDWRHTDNYKELGCYIIGYRKSQPEPATPSLPTYDPATHALVPLMTEDDADSFIMSNTYWESRGHILHAMKELGIIKPEPTPAERIANESGIALETVQKVLATQAALG